MQAQKILFATDYSESSTAALELATMLARGSGGRLLIVHVSNSELYPVGERFDEEPRPNPAEVEELKSVVPPDPNVPFEHRLLHGEPGSADTTKPAEVLLQAAEKERADLIVLGTHGRSGLRRIMMGSVAETVLREARCAVLVVKNRQAD